MKQSSAIGAGAVACVLLLGAVGWWLDARWGTPIPPAQASDLGPIEELSPDAREDGFPSRNIEGVSVAPVERPATEAFPAPDAISWHGTVESLEGRPVPGATVYLVGPGFPSQPLPGAAITRSDVNGEFTIASRAEAVEIAAQHEAYVPLLPALLQNASLERPVRIFLAPRLDLEGSVVDEAGRRVAGVSIRVRVPDALLVGLRLAEERTIAPSWSTRSDERGEFRFTAIAAAPGLRLTAFHPRFEPLERELKLGPRERLVLTLEHAPQGDLVLEGQVVDPRGMPVPDALVDFAERSVSTDLHGAFRFDLPSPVEPGTLVATAEGHRPGWLELDLTDIENGAEPVVVVLGGSPLTIQGRVMDGLGEPVVGASVWTDDGTPVPIGEGRALPEMLEDRIGGRGDARRSGRHQTTDASGRFELHSLLPRDYTLHAIHPHTLEVTTRANVPAGSKDVELILRGGDPLRVVAGRAISVLGEPVAGVRFLVQRQGLDPEPELRTPLLFLEQVISDAQGRFSFGLLAVEGTSLLPFGEDLAQPERRLLDPAEDLEHLEIVVPIQCRFQLVLESDPSLADELSLLDSSGKTQNLTVRMGSAATSGPVVRILDGTSELIDAPAGLHVLLLRRDGEEVLRREFVLTPGPPTILRL